MIKRIEGMHDQGCENRGWADALAYIRQLEATQPKWISVKDRLPDGSLTKCLVAFQSSGEFVVDIAFYCGEHGWMLSHWVPNDIAYWMPLPDGPEEK